MNLSSIINTHGLIEQAFTQPAMRIKPRSQKRPDMDVALKCVVNQIETSVIEEVAASVAEKLEEGYALYTVVNGDHADSPTKGAWESGIDEMVEAAIEPWVEVLSADWLGVNTIDTDLHKDNGIAVFANKLGKEYYKQLTYEKSPAQIMSSAGVLKKEVEAALIIHINPTEEEQSAMATTENAELDAVIQKIAAHIGKDHSVMDVYSDLEMVTVDDDEILASGAAPRLGIDDNDVLVLQMLALEHGSDTPDVIQKLIEALHGSAKPRKGARAKAAAKPTPVEAEEPPEDEAAAEEASQSIDVKALEALKAAGETDAVMAEGMGVSRATYNNYVTGKTEFAPTSDQAGFVRDKIVEKINILNEALAGIDGTPVNVVF